MSWNKFVQVPMRALTDPDLCAGAKVFLAQLLRWDWGGGCWLTDKQLAHELDCTDRSIRNYTRALEAHGHLWVFRDREGMVVRLVVRPSGVYPRPAWNTKALPLSRKNVSAASCVREHGRSKDFEVHAVETTGSGDRTVLPAPVVVAEQPQHAPQTPDAAALLVQAGVDQISAMGFQRGVSLKHIRAAIRYTQESRSEVLNPGGFIRAALARRWKLPAWCWEERAGDRQAKPERPSRAAVRAPGRPNGVEPTLDPPEGIYVGNVQCTQGKSELWAKALEVMDPPGVPERWGPPGLAEDLRECSLEDAPYGLHVKAPDGHRAILLRDHRGTIRRVLEISVSACVSGREESDD